jgi:hypothetical protein
MNDEIKEILDILEGRKKWYLHQQKNNSAFNDEDYVAYMVLDYITNLQQERDKYKMRCFKAYKMIWDNYGVLDKFGIEMLEDILKGKEDE